MFQFPSIVRGDRERLPGALRQNQHIQFAVLVLAVKSNVARLYSLYPALPLIDSTTKQTVLLVNAASYDYTVSGINKNMPGKSCSKSQSITGIRFVWYSGRMSFDRKGIALHKRKNCSTLTGLTVWPCSGWQTEAALAFFLQKKADSNTHKHLGVKHVFIHGEYTHCLLTLQHDCTQSSSECAEVHVFITLHYQGISCSRRLNYNHIAFISPLPPVLVTCLLQISGEVLSKFHWEIRGIYLYYT